MARVLNTVTRGSKVSSPLLSLSLSLSLSLCVCLLSQYHMSRGRYQLHQAICSPREVLFKLHRGIGTHLCGQVCLNTSGDATRGEGTPHCYATAASAMICLDANGTDTNICLTGLDLTYLLRNRFPPACPHRVYTHRLFQPHRKTLHLSSPSPSLPFRKFCNRHTACRQSNHRSVWRATFGLLHPALQLACRVKTEP
ncbi:hypothetical protein CGRA01v4_03286 [Colletotrichum graminicola]|nr:hypothetical protein CGRA01v4_03286 [Colletotrichum graminicola]